MVRAGIPFLLAGSIRDDGPLPEVLTDVMVAQQQMRELVANAGLCLMLSTMLHSIATSAPGRSGTGENGAPEPWMWRWRPTSSEGASAIQTAPPGGCGGRTTDPGGTQ